MNSTKLLLKICISEWEKPSRDVRELNVVKELGAKVVVMAKGEKNGEKDFVNDFDVYRFSSRPLGNRISKNINRFISMFTWAHYAKKFHADVISCHDIIALSIGYLSTLFISKSKKPKLVYDSHEFEIGRSANRNKFIIFLITRLERFLMKRCAFSIIVNDCIADEIRKIHGSHNKLVVARNIPPYWHLDDKKIAETRNEILSSLNVNENCFIVMYHGVLTRSRGIENILKAVSQTENAAAFILGSGDKGYLEELKLLASQLGIESRTLFHEAVPISDLYKYVGASNVGMVTVPAVCQSYYFMLPNKFFENIQSLTPVIVSNFPEVSAITNIYGIGLTVDPENVDDIINAINTMRNNNNFYLSCKQGLKTAKEELCWEKEKVNLLEAYKGVL